MKDEIFAMQMTERGGGNFNPAFSSFSPAWRRRPLWTRNNGRDLMETELRGVGGGGRIASRVSVKRIDSSRFNEEIVGLDKVGPSGSRKLAFVFSYTFTVPPVSNFPEIFTNSGWSWINENFARTLHKRRRSNLPNSALTLYQKVESTSTFQLLIFNRSSLRNYQTVCASLETEFPSF